MEELEALRRCREGDRAAFRLLVEKYGDLVTRSAYLMTHGPDLADDLAQDTFLAAWRGLGKFDLGRPFKPWLLRILVNCWLNHRRRRRPRLVSLENVKATTVAGGGPSPERMAVLHETHRSVRQAIESLDDGQRVTLLLRYFAGLSVAEIARAMSCPEGTVKSRLHRALAELRARLRDQYAVTAGADVHGAD